MKALKVISVIIAVPLVILLLYCGFIAAISFAAENGCFDDTIVYYDSVTNHLKSLLKSNYGIFLPDSTHTVHGKSVSSFRDSSFELYFKVAREDFDSLLDRGCWIAITRDFKELSEEETWNGAVHQYYYNKNHIACMRCTETDDGRVGCELAYGLGTTEGWF